MANYIFESGNRVRPGEDIPCGEPIDKQSSILTNFLTMDDTDLKPVRLWNFREIVHNVKKNSIIIAVLVCTIKVYKELFVKILIGVKNVSAIYKKTFNFPDQAVYKKFHYNIELRAAKFLSS